MAQRKITFAPEEFYHVYNRGTDKRIIFHDFGDKKYFLDLLYICNSFKPFVVREILETRTREELFKIDRGEPLVAIGAYCLMPNHFHILLQERAERGVSQFLHKLCTAYAMYFNAKYKRSGSLFQGPFQAQHVDSDRYLKYLYSYIHLNPVKIVDEEGWVNRKLINKKKSQEYLAKYLFSSYGDYTGPVRIENSILSKEYFPKYFSKASDFKKMIAEWLAFDGEQ